ncbi:hypothetical protein [Streptomyces sp. NPDC046805]|uniref:hypothetical protein n=1 Tax=Streptomyces sp. NPDC046805 TaxID=3155134 RepID=UPI0033DAD69E
MTRVALTTEFTELFGGRHPIALAPMGGAAGGAPTAAVRRGGGLGLLGAGSWDLDIARGAGWPSKYTARTLSHPYLDQWRGREAELAADVEAQRAYQEDVARGTVPSLPIWAGEAVHLISDLPSAADLVATLAAQAEAALDRAGRR